MERFFTCNLCEAMCGLQVDVEGARVGAIRGDKEDVLSRGHLCPKALALGELYDDPDRLRTPLIREQGGFRPASWEEALALVAQRLRQIQKRHGRDAVALYVGNPVVHSHRSALAAQLLTAALGSRNRFDPNSQDGNPRLFACMQVYGDALSMAVPDLARIHYLLMLGANPAVSNGSQMALGDPKAQFAAVRARGGRIVLIDPRKSESAPWCTEHHYIRPGGDAALLLAVLHVLFAERRINAARARRIGSGYDELRRIARDFSPARVAPAIGIDASVIATIARDFAAAPGACAYARVGVCQNQFGPLAAWLVEVLNLVTGNVDREGGAMFATPAADIAPLGRLLVGNNYGRWRSRVRGLPEFLGALPSAVLSEEIETPGPGQIRAMVCLAGNPVLSTPNGVRLERALRGLEFIAGIDFYVNETSRHADVILPPRHIFETGNYSVILSRFVVRNLARYSAPIVPAADDTRDDWQIAVELAMRLALPNFAPLRKVVRALARNLPERLVDILLRIGPRRTTLRQLGAAPHGLDFGPLVRSRGGHVRTRDGRACLTPAPLLEDLPRLQRWLDEPRAESLVLIGRRHLRSNNSWMHNLPVLAKGPDRARLLIHPSDATRLGIADGSLVTVRSRVGTLQVLVTVSAQIMPGVVSLPHGYGHAAARATLRIAGALPGPSVNAVTDEAFIEPILGTSILSGVPVRVEI